MALEGPRTLDRSALASGNTFQKKLQDLSAPGQARLRTHTPLKRTAQPRLRRAAQRRGCGGAPLRKSWVGSLTPGSEAVPRRSGGARRSPEHPAFSRGNQRVLSALRATATGLVDHGPFYGDRVAHLPSSTHRLRGCCPSCGPRLHHLCGCACQAWLQSVLLAPHAYVSRFLLPDDGGTAGLLPREFTAALPLAEGPSTLPLGPAAAGPAVCTAGLGPCHPPQGTAWQNPRGHMARAVGDADCTVGSASVLRRGGATLPQVAAPMAPGQAQAVPCHFWASGLPSG